MALRLDYQGHRPHQGTGGAAGLEAGPGGGRYVATLRFPWRERTP